MYAPSRSERVRTALLAGASGIAGSFAVAGSTPEFVVAPVNAWVVALTPTPVIAITLRALGKTGELVSVAVAFAIALAALAAATALAMAVASRLDDALVAVGFTYGAGWAVTAVVTGTLYLAVGAAVPMAVVVGLEAVTRRGGRDAVVVDSRRRVLARVVGLAGFGGLAYLVGRTRTSEGGGDIATLSPDVRAAVDRRLDDAAERSLDVPGIPGLVSDVAEFYEVDIDAVNPSVRAADWSLSVTGAVETERTLSYGDLTNSDPAHRIVTLRCVGDPVDGDLMDTALWTGVPAGDVLAPAGPRDAATHVMVRAVDGYFEEFPLDVFRRSFLAYGMNDRLLPRKHGYPARLLVPGHWGEISVKWISEIEVLEGEQRGYWERRGWHGTGPVNTVAKLWAVNRPGGGRIQVAGHAFAGTRGVRQVEVSVDGGETWNRARLGPALDDPGTWRQWAYEWQAGTGAHEVVVRAVDGTGALQPRERQQPFPRGATGWASRTVRV